VVDVRDMPPEEARLDEVVAHLRAAGVVAYPTETVYGFGGVCTPAAVDRVRRLKRREGDKPFLVLVRSAEDLDGLAWTDEARELGRIFWPGAVTLVLADPGHIFPPGVRSADGSVAARVSPHPLARRLVEALGEPVTSTSANAPGAPPARSAEEVLDAAASLGAGEELLVLNGGLLAPSGPSTIVDCTGPTPVVVREGTVPIHRLRCALPELHGI
jgi:L-threonylcarbamoyladenylate synthase